MSSTLRQFANPLRLLAFGAAILTLQGMTCGPASPDPCELDRLGCVPPDPNETFYLETCPAELAGPLEVEVGSGESAFSGFSAGAGPVVNIGPQGGQHVFMGLRVANARVDISPRLKVHFYLGQGADCMPPEDGVTVPRCAVKLGERDLVLGATGFELHLNPAGMVEESGLVVFVAMPATDSPSVVAVTVEDQCHRKGAAFQAWTVY